MVTTGSCLSAGRGRVFAVEGRMPSFLLECPEQDRVVRKATKREGCR